MQIDPKLIFIFGVWTSILLLVGGSPDLLNGVFPAAWVPHIVAWCVFLSKVNNVVLTAGIGFSSYRPGPLTGLPANPPAAVKALVWFVVIGASLALAMPAHAQPRRLPVKGALETNIATFLNGLLNIQDAQTMATQIPGLQDPVGQACWAQLAPLQALVTIHPVPLTFKIATDIEAARLAAIALNQVCANPNCGQMFLDATNAANAIAGAPIPISLNGLCAKVPVIGTSAVPTKQPIVVPAPAPAPAPVKP